MSHGYFIITTLQKKVYKIIYLCYKKGYFMTNWNSLADQATIENTIQALKTNGIQALVVENGKEAKEKVASLLPKDSEVMTMTSVTLDSIGVSDMINSGDMYKSVKKTLSTMDRKTQGNEMNKLGAAPEYTVGSVHAITEDGKVVIASNTGSQLPAYVYGASHVIWVVGTQKIVKNLDAAMNRIYEYVLPLESERANKAYGGGGSNVSKLLIINKEVNPQRLTIVFVKDVLGF
jgi:hypothetical protein